MPSLSPLTRSRPRFWLYLLGPFVLGVLSGPEGWRELTNPLVLAMALYFTFPANYWIYTVNDIADYDTDSKNDKKKSYEKLLDPSLHVKAIVLGILTTLPFLVVAIFSEHVIQTMLALVGFLFFGTFYSLPPIRAKAVPFLDAFFNILYVFPALVGYSLVTSTLPNIWLVIAATLWCMAMHIFSAVPDIQADTDAKLKTTATTLGPTVSILVCAVLYFSASVIASGTVVGTVATAIGSCYVAVMILALAVSSRREALFAIYRAFPLLNTLVGAILTFTVLALRA